MPRSQHWLILQFELKKQRDQLKQKMAQTADVCQREFEIAREFKQSGNVERARLVMRKRKLQQSLIEKLEANLVNIETLVASALQAVTF